MVPEPTSEEIRVNSRMEWADEDGRWHFGFACWYPQMGGYVGRCIIERESDCFNVYVWHDGDFPFEGERPVSLHHCDAEQFIDFGKTVQRLLTENSPSAS